MKQLRSEDESDGIYVGVAVAEIKLPKIRDEHYF